MLSLEECRKILGVSAAEMTDEQLIEVRDSLYSLCESVLDKHFGNAVTRSDANQGATLN